MTNTTQQTGKNEKYKSLKNNDMPPTPPLKNDKRTIKEAPARQVAIWLFFTAFMVLCMAVIGAITRLTESGLSMVEWRPLIGALPPMSEAEWQRVFTIYQETPEFQKKNSWMGIEDFKKIFFWEWFHRFWGRLIGLVYALPLAYFWIRGQIPAGFQGKLLIGLALGATQAVMGWYMVESGLVDQPSVSHYRLAAHLSLAFIIFGYLLWLGLELWGRVKTPAIFCIRRHGWTGLALLAATIIWGGFVAGLDAGLVYNSFPLMDGKFFPAGSPDVLNDHGWVQFTHRWLAVGTALFLLAFAWRVKNWVLALVICGQVALGILTLITQVHMHVAASHQAGAFILAGILIYTLHGLKRT